jgi:hypothetical protein
VSIGDAADQNSGGQTDRRSRLLPFADLQLRLGIE